MAKAKENPGAKGRRTCIYCGGFGMTKEHLWPNWLKSYIPRTMLNHRSISQVIHPDRSKNQVEIKNRAGDPHSATLKVVCADCNSGWMSALQQSAKPYLTPMLTGDECVLYRNGQTAIAAWTAMSVMTADFLDKDKISITYDERNRFSKNQRAPSHWRIWIGRYKRTDGVERWNHSVIPFAEDETVAVPDGVIPDANAQSSTIRLGDHLVIHAMSSPVARRIIKNWNLHPEVAPAMTQIWPVKHKKITWPGDTILDDGKVAVMADEFISRCDRVARRREGFE